jgi:hypothetical protein
MSDVANVAPIAAPTRVDRVAAEAATVRPGLVLLEWLTWLLYGIGWVATKIVLAVYMVFKWVIIAARWVVAAVKIGAMDALARQPHTKE